MAGPDFTIRHGARLKNMPPASVQVTINVRYARDAPPALVEAVGRTLAQFVLVMDDDELMEKMQAWFAQHQAHKQREADHVARQLLGEDGP